MPYDEPEQVTFRSFDELVKTRKKSVKWNRRNGFNFSQILTGIYENPAHFLYELVQNAEDARASVVEFDLRTDCLVIRHDGRRFNLRDVQGVTGIGESPKVDDLTEIGRFGIGFKSVFAVTSSPIVRSGRYNFRIDNIFVPVELENARHNDGWTEFVLPFDHSTRSPESVYSLVSKELLGFGVNALLFLFNIRALKWRTQEGRGASVRSEYRSGKVPTASFVHISHTDGEADHFLRFSKPSHIGDGRLVVSVAYRLEKGGRKGYRIVREDESDTTLSVHFPTTRQTRLGFRVNGPFKTTVNRADVPFDEDENLKLMEDIAGLVRESLSGLRDMGYLTTHAFEVLPTGYRGESEPVYASVRAAIVEALRDDRILATEDDKFETAQNVALARDADLVKLLSGRDLKRLFGRGKWLSPRLMGNANGASLIDLLTSELNVREVSTEQMFYRIDNSLMKGKSDKWVSQLYDILDDQPALSRTSYQTKRAPLWDKPIIRLESKSHVKPYDEKGNPNAYLPDSNVPNSHLPTIRRAVASKKSALRFLRDTLNLRKPDVVAEVENEILPRLCGEAANWSSDRALADFNLIVRAYRMAETQRRERLVGKLRTCRFIPGRVGDKECLVAPLDAYYRTSDLADYFGSRSPVAFVSDSITVGDDVRSLFRGVGVAEVPRHISSDRELTHSERQALRNGRPRVKSESVENPTLDGLSQFLKASLSPVQSAALWRLILLGLAQNARYLKGTYSFTPQSRRQTKHFDSEALRLLRVEPWLVDIYGQRRKPNEVSIEELSEEFDRIYPSIERNQVPVLSEVLLLKPSAVAQLPDEVRQKLELTQDRTVAETQEAFQLLDAKRAKEAGTAGDDALPEWIPDVDPKTGGKILDFVPSQAVEIEPPKLRRGSGSSGGVGGKKKSRVTLSNKPVGTWGEERVFSLLKRDHPDDDVIWNNERENEQSGYDIEVRRDGEIIEYAEVKSTVDEGEKVVVTLSWAQWDWAEWLDKKGQGEMYVLYVVPAAGTLGANPIRIPNPVHEWRKRHLRARAIELEVHPGSNT